METSLRKKFRDLQDLDMQMIKGIPWAEDMWKTLLTGLTKTFLNWTQVALKMSNNEDDLKEWVHVFTEHYEDTCCELVSDIEYLKSNLIANIESLLQKVERLCKTLRIVMPVLDIDNECLYKVQLQLKKRVEELEHSVETRKTELNKLRQKQLELCKSLGKEPRVINDNPLPSSDELLDFHNHIEKLEQEKFDRLENFYLLKEEIISMTRELNVSPSTEFEKNVLSQDDSKFIVTEENMKELEFFHKSIKRQLENVREEISNLRTNVDHYWDLLDIPLQERQEFREKYTGNSINVLDALTLEVRRCGDLKKANIKIFVDKLRNELSTIWDQCHCSETVKEDFSYFISDCYTEDLLELHEIELKKWKSYYEENKEMLLLLNKHVKLWNKMVELEDAATGPDRYNNRGGKLLKEEKERNLLAKQIPKIEETLRELAYKYEKHHGFEFKTYDKTIEDYIYNMHADRENVKREKLSARKVQREQPMMTLTPAKSAICLFPGPGMSSTSKRKLFDNPSTDRKKIPKSSSRLVLTEPKKKGGYNGTIPKIVLNVMSQSKRLSTERKKRIEKIRRRSALKLKHDNKLRDNASSTETEYVDFENEVSSRMDCRSTINPFLVPLPETPVPSSSTVRTPSKTNSKHMSHRNSPGPGTPRNAKFSAAKTNIRMNF